MPSPITKELPARLSPDVPPWPASACWPAPHGPRTQPLSSCSTLAPTKLSRSPTAKYFDATAEARASDGSLSAQAHGHFTGPVVSHYDNAQAAAVGATTFQSSAFAIDLTQSWSVKAGLIVNVWGNAGNDFYSTAKLVDILLFDAQGKAITGYQITSASGVNHLAAAVPEPDPLALCGVATLLLAGARARRAHRAHHCTRRVSM